jgi:hypothetical protein
MNDHSANSAESATAPPQRNAGPWAHRVAFGLFTVVFGVLCFWLIQFLLSDIADRPFPRFDVLREEMLEPELNKESDTVAEQFAANDRAIAEQRQRQQVLRESTAEAQRTMNQLLDFQRLALEKGANPSPEEQRALADSQQLFLKNQQQFQELNAEVTRLEDNERLLRTQQREIDARIHDATAPIQEEFERQWQQQLWYTAALKLALLLPLVAVAAFAWRRSRGTLYVPLAYAFASAVALHLILVMHECFPERYFRYLLIGVALFAVVRILIFLVRQVARPKADWLVRQFREAYQKYVCPVCSFPIRRGSRPEAVMAHAAASHANAIGTNVAKEEPYTCPCCAVRLFEECPKCHGLRHALLPACEHCGSTKTADEIALASSA